MAKVSNKVLGRRRRIAALSLLVLFVFVIFSVVRCTRSLSQSADESDSAAEESSAESAADADVVVTDVEISTNQSDILSTTTVAIGTDIAGISYSIPQVSELPTYAELEVNAILQNPELPTGCEITSLTMALNYAGFDVDKLTMADDYLICADAYTATFGEAFIGSPYDSSSWGCYAPVIKNTANAYLEDQGSDMTALDITGSDFDTLLSCVAAGTPVMIWISIGLTSSIEEKYYWTTEDGKEAVFLSNEHCVLLCGYDLSANTVIVADPLEGLIAYDRSTVQDRYETMYEQAVILAAPDTTETETETASE